MCLVSAGVMAPSRLRRLIDAAGSPGAALGQPPAALAEASGLEEYDVQRLVREANAETVRLAAARDLKARETHGIRLVTLNDPDYPPLLKATPEPPLVLWAWGAFEPGDVLAASILGSSRCTDYGATQARRFAAAYADHGLTLVNSGEVGIDAQALDAAHDAGGRVVVALGAGLFAHGRPHHPLFERVVESGRGVVLSSVPTATPPDAVNQVMADYLVTGLAIGLLVVEAGAQSGPMIAARIAREQCRRDLFALPGRLDDANSAGSLRLIAEGSARLALKPADVLDPLIESAQQLAYRVIRSQPALRLHGRPAASRDPFQIPLDRKQRHVLGVLDRPATPEDLAEAAGLPLADVRSALYRLALGGTLTKSTQRYAWVAGAS
ncbi:MAG: DNA-processing protein DprA [Planctomycetota bacterium]